MSSKRIPTTTETEALEGYLDSQRDAMVGLLDGISDEEARIPATVSTLSLLALLKHSALWEGRWFQTVVAGRVFDGEWPYSDVDWTVADFELTADDDVATWLERYSGSVAESRRITAELDPESFCQLERFTTWNLRSVLLHLIAEYARHCGHGDIIREAVLAEREP